MALPTNVPSALSGASNSTGGVNNYANKGVAIGALQTVALVQGTDLGDALTAVLASQWTAQFAGIIRAVAHSNYSVAATMSFLVYNSTQAANVIGATTPTTNTAGSVTTITTPAFSEGDVIQLRVTTSGGSGASKGLTAWLLVESFADSSSNPNV